MICLRVDTGGEGNFRSGIIKTRFAGSYPAATSTSVRLSANGIVWECESVLARCPIESVDSHPDHGYSIVSSLKGLPGQVERLDAEQFVQKFILIRRNDLSLGAGNLGLLLCG